MISILCPTRDRMKMATAMAVSAFNLSHTMANVEILLYVDDDDPQLEDYKTLDTTALDTLSKTQVIVGPRLEKMTEYWNVLAKQAKGDIFLQANDDILFRTPGWDKIVEDEFAKVEDRILLVTANDLSGTNLTGGAHSFVHRRWVDAVGYFIPPYFSSDYGDTWINEVADKLGRRKYLPDLVVEHLHVIYGKMAEDQTHRERMARGSRDGVDKLYKELASKREEDAAKLRAAIAGKPLWTIMILTQPSRAEYLRRLLARLEPQLAGKPVELDVMMCEPRITVGANRRRLMDRARGEYINFIDDDDLVAEDYVARILPLLDGVDYVGFRVQTFTDGVAIAPTHHALKYGGVGYDETAKINYRDISHLNPTRRELAVQGVMDGGVSEDSRWRDSMKAQGLLKTEHVVDEDFIMYFYYARTHKDDADYKFVTMPPETVAPKFGGFSFQQKTAACPHCGSTATAAGNGGMICNQCGVGF